VWPTTRSSPTTHGRQRAVHTKDEDILGLRSKRNFARLHPRCAGWIDLGACKRQDGHSGGEGRDNSGNDVQLRYQCSAFSRSCQDSPNQEA
jgi:hypothetical protein